MHRSFRHKAIIRALGSQPISVHALADLTGTSPVTIRRDLTDLEGHGLLRRTHGGAVAMPQRGQPLPYDLRAAENVTQKAQIAARVAELVSDGMSVILDNGSTMVPVAAALAGRPLTVLCLGLRSAVELGRSSATTIVTPGGTVEPGSLATRAPAATEALANFRADVAVLGACSASPSGGLTVTTFDDAAIKRAILASSATVILAATGDKLSRTTSFRFGAIEDVDHLVTTPDAPEAALIEFRAAGVRVHLTT